MRVPSVPLPALALVGIATSPAVPDMRAVILLCIFAFAAVVSAIHRAGSIEVDNWYRYVIGHALTRPRTFDKVVDGGENVLVVFQEQSWKEVNGFEKVVDDLRDRKDLLIVRVDGMFADE